MPRVNNQLNYQWNENLRKTKWCKFGPECPRKSKDCWYAHKGIEELRPRPKVCVSAGDTNLGGGRIGGGGIGGGGIGGGKSSSRTKKKTGSTGNKDSTQAVKQKKLPDLGKMCLGEPIKRPFQKPLSPPLVPATKPTGNKESSIIKRPFPKQVVTPMSFSPPSIVEKPLPPLVPATLTLPTLDFATPPLPPPAVECEVVKPKPVFNIVDLMKNVSPRLGIGGELNLPSFANEAEMMLMATKQTQTGGLIKRYEAIRNNVSYVSAMQQFALRFLNAKYGQLNLPSFAQELEIMMYGETRDGGLIQRYEELLAILDADWKAKIKPFM